MPYKDIENQKESVRRWYAKHGLEYSRRNRDRINENGKRYRESHKEKKYARDKKWKQENKDKVRKHTKTCYEKNHSHWNKRKPSKEQFNKAMRRWRKNHPEEAISRSVVTRMFILSDLSKSSKSRMYVGCSSGFLRNHIESLFEEGMTWENYGEWHVDHIVPLSWWNIREHPENAFVASHWTNLQPKWAFENISKSNRYAG